MKLLDTSTLTSLESNETEFLNSRNDDLLKIIKEIQLTQSNCSAVLRDSLSKLLEALQVPENRSEHFRKMMSQDENDSSDNTFAVLYIVFVLLFFATSLVVVLVRYLLRQRETHRLETFYNNYLQRKPPRTDKFDIKRRRLTDPEIWYEDSQTEGMLRPETRVAADRVKDKKPKPRTVSTLAPRNTRTPISKLASGKVPIQTVSSKRARGLNKHTATLADQKS